MVSYKVSSLFRRPLSKMTVLTDGDGLVPPKATILPAGRPYLDALKSYFTKMRNFLFYYEYLDAEKLQGFTKYKYKGIDTNPINNQITMPLCDRMAVLIPTWLAPNVLTLITFLISLLQYLILAYYDYSMYSSSTELINMLRIPNWMWFASGIVLLACIALDALDGKHARRIGACSPVGEILDHSIDTWRLTAPVLTCFYSIFGRLDYGLPGYRLMRLLMATQSVVAVMFWQQYVTGILVYSWGYDIMQYMMAWFYFHTWYREGAEWWQCDGWLFGTNAVITEKWGYFIICTVALPMQFYHFLRYQRSSMANKLSLKEFLRPIAAPVSLFVVAFVLSEQNLYDSVIHEDPRAALWLVGIIFCDTMWRLLIANMTKTSCPWWNRLISFFILCTIYWYIRPRSILGWDRWTIQAAAFLATCIHLHLVVCTLNQMCQHFGIYLFSVQPRKPIRSESNQY